MQFLRRTRVSATRGAMQTGDVHGGACATLVGAAQ
jgi:hypothetical protein